MQLNLDAQSGLPLTPEVLAAMQPFLIDSANPASLHQRGVRARKALDQARGSVAVLLECQASELLFTSSGTESANLAIKGACQSSPGKRHLIVSATEHPAVARTAEWLADQGYRLTVLPVDARGLIEPEVLKEAITRETALVCIHWVNHEIGTIQPMQEIISICAQHHVPLFSDACAAAGVLPLDFQKSSPDLVSLSPHRFGGPKGVGVLYVKRGQALSAQLHGGRQEHDLRAGTENLPGIVGTGVAALAVKAQLPQQLARMKVIQQTLWESLCSRVSELTLLGASLGEHRIVNNLNIAAAGAEGEAQALKLDLMGYAVASGAACQSRELRHSPVLRAIGASPQLSQTQILLTLAGEYQPEQLEAFGQAYEKTVRRLREMNPGYRPQ